MALRRTMQGLYSGRRLVRSYRRTRGAAKITGIGPVVGLGVPLRAALRPLDGSCNSGFVKSEVENGPALQGSDGASSGVGGTCGQTPAALEPPEADADGGTIAATGDRGKRKGATHAHGDGIRKRCRLVYSTSECLYVPVVAAGGAPADGASDISKVCVREPARITGAAANGPASYATILERIRAKERVGAAGECPDAKRRRRRHGL